MNRQEQAEIAMEMRDMAIQMCGEDLAVDVATMMLQSLSFVERCKGTGGHYPGEDGRCRVCRVKL